jgi:hypothetical protein
MEKGEEMTYHRAILRLTYTALEETLHLPEGARVVGLEHNPDNFQLARIGLIVEHPDLPEWEPGEQPISVSIEYTGEPVIGIVPFTRFKRWL